MTLSTPLDRTRCYLQERLVCAEGPLY